LLHALSLIVQWYWFEREPPLAATQRLVTLGSSSRQQVLHAARCGERHPAMVVGATRYGTIGVLGAIARARECAAIALPAAPAVEPPAVVLLAVGCVD
jgi:hypothetical protein